MYSIVRLLKPRGEMKSLKYLFYQRSEKNLSAEFFRYSGKNIWVHSHSGGTRMHTDSRQPSLSLRNKRFFTVQLEGALMQDCDY